MSDRKKDLDYTKITVDNIMYDHPTNGFFAVECRVFPRKEEQEGNQNGNRTPLPQRN